MADMIKRLPEIPVSSVLGGHPSSPTAQPDLGVPAPGVDKKWVQDDAYYA